MPHLTLYGRDYVTKKRMTTEAAFADLKMIQSISRTMTRQVRVPERRGPITLNSGARRAEIVRVMHENRKLLSNLEQLDPVVRTADLIKGENRRRRYMKIPLTASAFPATMTTTLNKCTLKMRQGSLFTENRLTKSVHNTNLGRAAVNHAFHQLIRTILKRKVVGMVLKALPIPHHPHGVLAMAVPPVTTGKPMRAMNMLPLAISVVVKVAWKNQQQPTKAWKIIMRIVLPTSKPPISFQEITMVVLTRRARRLLLKSISMKMTFAETDIYENDDILTVVLLFVLRFSASRGRGHAMKNVCVIVGSGEYG